MNESILKEPIATAVPHPFADLLGFRIVSRGDAACRAELDVRKEHFNPHGLVHGAVLYALADTSMGGALTSTLSEQEVRTNVELETAAEAMGPSRALRAVWRIRSSGARWRHSTRPFQGARTMRRCKAKFKRDALPRRPYIDRASRDDATSRGTP